MRDPGPGKRGNPLIVADAERGTDILLLEGNIRGLESVVDRNTSTRVNGHFPVKLGNIIVSDNL